MAFQNTPARPFVEVRQIVLEDHRRRRPSSVSRSQRNASVRFGTGDQPGFAAGIAMSGDKRLAVGVRHDQRVVADRRRLARQRPVDVELLRAELDDARRRQEPARRPAAPPRPRAPRGTRTGSSCRRRESSVMPRSSTTSSRFETGFSVRSAATATSGSTPSAVASVNAPARFRMIGRPSSGVKQRVRARPWSAARTTCPASRTALCSRRVSRSSVDVSP